MKFFLILLLSSGLLFPGLVQPQDRGPETPSWVYLIGVGGTAIAGGIWFYKNYMKTPALPKRKTLRQQSLDEIQYIATAAEIKALKQLKSDEEIHAFMAKFIFADFQSTGNYKQIYSSEWGESSDPRVFIIPQASSMNSSEDY